MNHSRRSSSSLSPELGHPLEVVPARSTGSKKFTLPGDGLCIGRGSGDAVSEDYTSPGTFTGGPAQGVGRPDLGTQRGQQGDHLQMVAEQNRGGYRRVP